MEVSEDAKEVRPRIYQWRWWKLFFSAMDIRKYDAEKWGVYHFSSAVTALQFTGVFAAVKAFFPWLTLTAIKSFFGKLFGFVGALGGLFSS